MNEVLRQEKKYFMTITDSLKLCARLEGIMIKDVHNGACGYGIRSLYFDTLDDEDYEEKVDGVELPPPPGRRRSPPGPEWPQCRT